MFELRQEHCSAINFSTEVKLIDCLLIKGFVIGVRGESSLGKR